MTAYATAQTTLPPARLPLPDFPALSPDSLKADIEVLIKEGFALLKSADAILEDQEMAFVQQMDAFENRLHQTWGILSNLNATCNTPTLRETYNALLPELSRYYTELGQSQALYQAYVTLAEQADFTQLPAARQSAITLAIRDFKLSGVSLTGNAKVRYGQISERLSQLSSQFSDHLLDATQSYRRVLAEHELAGLPDSAQALVRQMAATRLLNGEEPPATAIATLDAPVYIAIATYADDRALREELYHAYVTRASELSSSPKAQDEDNSPLMTEILSLRQEMAALLGFGSYAELSLASKMAPDIATVRNFLTHLASEARTPALRDLAELQDEAKRHGIDELKPWDSAYLAEKVKQRKYSLSQESLKPYFPAPKAIAGLFQIVGRLYGIEIEPRAAAVWADGVDYYEITEQGQVIAGFYFDMYARTGKRGGAWMSGFRPRMQTEHGLQLPVAFMIGNFTPPVGDQPALLTHDELVTLFHEFGHGLHHMLTEVDVLSVSGINGVAWDAVELPSQFMEFWTWEDEALAIISQHFETGENLPKALLDAMLAARHFQSGLQALRQIEFALFDLDIHSQVPAPDTSGIQATLDRLRQAYAVLQPPAYNRFQHSFSHIFAGGYAAGYYSYKWAEVLASDAFDRFEEEGIFNPATGQAFRSSILAAGAQKPARDTFQDFRGRDARIDALLRHQGWTSTAAQSPSATTGQPAR